ncbi:MAG: IS4 family transposase [Desulfamplus sp.]|nr:IS4 family transposase [Desulfamplus sp.]
MSKKQLSEGLKSLPAEASLLPFESQLSPLIKESLEELGKDTCRKGSILPPTLMVWFVLAMTLRRDLNYSRILEWLTSGCRWLSLTMPVKLVADGALSHARAKLGAKVFLLLFDKLSLALVGIEPDFHGYITLMFDGVTMTMPDSKENLLKFGKPRGSRGSSGFPMLRAVALMQRASRTVIDLADAPIRGKGTGERSLMMQILKRTRLHKALYLFDAGFYSFALVHQMAASQQFFIMKVARTVTFPPLAMESDPWKDGSYAASICGKIEDPRRSSKKRKAYAHYESMVRVIDVQVNGFRPFRLITNILDPEISAMEIARHYHKRWDIELGYAEIKTRQAATLRGQAPTILRSKRPDLVQQELYALFISYNLVRMAMFQAAGEHGVDPLQLSFTQALKWTFDAVEQMQTATPLQLPQLLAYYRKLLAESPIDRPRRKRSNPRVVKVKMSAFKKKGKADRGQNIDFEKETTIVPLSLENQEFEEAA